jgi:hypothetical protein
MAYLRLTETGIVYPYTLAELRAAHPQTSFPRTLSLELLADFGVQEVQEVPPPEHDPLTQDCEELPPAGINGVWTQQWRVVAASPEDVAVRLARWRSQMVCSRAQGKLALLHADLLDIVEAWVATQDRKTQIEYAERGEWRRDWPLVVSAGAAFGLTDTDLDNLFIQAPSL